MSRQPEYHPILSIHEITDVKSKNCDVTVKELYGETKIDIPHKHDFFNVLIFKKGKGIHIIDFVEYQIEDYQIHLIFPDRVHQWTTEKETIGHQLLISREWCESFLPTLKFSSFFYFERPAFSISEEIYHLFINEFYAIRDELNAENTVWDIVQKRSELIGLLISKSVESAFKEFYEYNSNPIISKFLSLINDYFKTERSVSFYAEKLHISANYLNVICKKSLHLSASTMIQNRILLEAKRLLKVSEMSVKDIVYDLGFYDNASFSKFFKAQTGMTPSQFKE